MRDTVCNTNCDNFIVSGECMCYGVPIREGDICKDCYDAFTPLDIYKNSHEFENISRSLYKETPKILFLVSTKASLLTDKVNKAIEDIYNKHGIITEITPLMSPVGDTKGYMLVCMIRYYLSEEDTNDASESV